ncbi:MAG: flagellar hook-basal body complex protein FliE [Planctomycetes bacterium]|nr:flagellar hook-basal body complex protein FliE [Planctomycetota bacterium]
MNIASVTAPSGASAASPLAESLRPSGTTPEKGGEFGRLIDQVLGKITGAQAEADTAVRDLALGKTDNIHNVLLSVAKADLTFRLVLEIRNKLTEALQEIMRMQV